MFYIFDIVKMKQKLTPDQRNAARISGFAIIIMTIAAGIAANLSIGSLRVENNAAETFGNILEAQMLFRTGIFSWFMVRDISIPKSS